MNSPVPVDGIRTVHNDYCDLVKEVFILKHKI